MARIKHEVSATAQQIRHLTREIADGVQIKLMLEPGGFRKLLGAINGDSNEPIELPISLKIEIEEEGD